MKDYDVVIVGAGPGGCITAKTLEGTDLKVCLIDTKPREKIGEKICGDAIGKGHFDFLSKKIKLSYPSREIKCTVRGVKIFSPDEEAVFKVETKEGGYMIDRLLFGQHLLSEVDDAELMDDAKVVGLHKNGVVVNRNGKSRKVNCRIVVDASGVSAVVRGKVNSPYMEKEIDRRDIAICYREIREYEFEDAEYCHIYLKQEMTGGGYMWIFPEGGHVNIGVGVQYPLHPKKQYEIFMKDREIGHSKLLNAGGGVVPTRRPLESLVALYGNVGFMLVGDAACQANPIHGGGIGEAMIAGYIAGDSIKKISESKNIDKISLGDLWRYNFTYTKKYGAKNAALDAFRIFLQSLTDKQINFGMGNRLINEADLIKISSGKEINLSAADKLRRAARGITNLNLLKKLKFTANKMDEIRSLYHNYPSPKEFFEWRKKVKAVYDDVREMMGIRRS